MIFCREFHASSSRGEDHPWRWSSNSCCWSHLRIHEKPVSVCFACPSSLPVSSQTQGPLVLWYSMAHWLHFFRELKGWLRLKEDFPFPAYSALLDSLNQASCVAKRDGELVEHTLVHVPLHEVFLHRRNTVWKPLAYLASGDLGKLLVA